MSYVLASMIASQETIEAVSSRITGSRVIPLGQGLGMIPITDVVRNHLAAQAVPLLDSRYGLFYFLPLPLVALCTELSKQSVVAYVEAEFFGGIGAQHCVVWENGTVILGPLEDQWAINQALRLLGVKSHGFFDEFDAVGLSRHGDTEDWDEEIDAA